MAENKNDKIEISNADAIKTISAVLADLKYGSITITVHDRKIVQIDKVEKIRIDK